MNERQTFVLEVLKGWNTMSQVCESFGISRRTGYKWVERYHLGGFEALADESRAPRRQGQETAPELVGKIVELRKQRPTWGPKKLRARLEVLHPEIDWPARSTIILVREGLIQKRRRKRRPKGAWNSARTQADVPNRVWTADFKGEFRLGSGQFCHPLTILDSCSRYLLACQALPSTGLRGARATFEQTFAEHGLPEVIRTDNGTPFRGQAVAGLSQLAVWWLLLGIRIEWTRPSHPQDNGAHERMHRTLKAEAARPGRETAELQQRAFDRFRRVYNEERPHEVLGLQPPAAIYRVLERRMPRRLASLEYPAHFYRRRISKSGWMTWRKRLYFVSSTLHHQTVGLEHKGEGRFELYFGPVLLGEFDEQQQVMKRFTGRKRSTLTGEKVLPM